MTALNVAQFTVLVTCVIPGVVYQAVRARLAGEAPQNRDTTNKVLRALAASVVLASIYLIVFGRTIVTALGGDAAQTRRWVSQHARLTGALALLLLFAVPALAAILAARRWQLGARVSAYRYRGPLDPDRRLGRALVGRAVNRLLTWVEARSETRSGLQYDPTPTAWDWAVDHGASSEGYVRALGKDGQWKGGAFGRNSYFTTYPELPAIYVEQAWQLDDDGRLRSVQDASRGAWIPCAEALTVEFIAGNDPSRDDQPGSMGLRRRDGAVQQDDNGPSHAR